MVGVFEIKRVRPTEENTMPTKTDWEARIRQAAHDFRFHGRTDPVEIMVDFALQLLREFAEEAADACRKAVMSLLPPAKKED